MSSLLNMITGGGSSSSNSTSSSSSTSSHSSTSDHSTTSGAQTSGAHTYTGGTGYGTAGQVNTQTTTRTDGYAADGVNEDGYITRSEEQLRVHKETVETGRATIGKHVTTETVSTTVPISKERVILEREPITSADVQAGHLNASIGEATYEMRLKEERAFAEKEVVPIEKVRLRKETETEQQQVGAELRKEHIDFVETPGAQKQMATTTTHTTTTTGTGVNAGGANTKY